MLVRACRFESDHEYMKYLCDNARHLICEPYSIENLHKMAEEGKVTVRNHRREAIDLVKKQEKGKELSTDDARRHQEEIQKLTDKAIAEVETAAQGKEKELMDI